MGELDPQEQRDDEGQELDLFLNPNNTDLDGAMFTCRITTARGNFLKKPCQRYSYIKYYLLRDEILALLDVWYFIEFLMLVKVDRWTNVLFHVMILNYFTTLLICLQEYLTVTAVDIQHQLPQTHLFIIKTSIKYHIII